MKSVFISSTSKDLLAHRAAVKAAIERLQLRPIDMVNFGSQPGDATEVSLSEVAKADIFVGIIANRYGYIPPNSEKSVTEQEFDYAGSLKIPRLMYLLKPDYSWEPDHPIVTEADHHPRLVEFKTQINTLVRSEFTSPDDLAKQVATDLANQLKIIARHDQRQRRIVLAGTSLIILLLIVVIAALFLTAPDEEKGSIALADRQATNAAVAAENQTATAGVWTPTPTVVPTTFPAGFNVVLPGFAYVTEEGELTTSTEADQISDLLTTAIQELDEVDHVSSWRDSGVGHLLATDPVERERQAAELARILGADVVIYGLIREQNDLLMIEPEYYITAKFATQDPELIGSDRFGNTITLPAGSDELDLDDFQNRLEMLRQFVKGLSLYIAGDFTQAQATFEDALAIDDQGMEVLYIFAGNAALRAQNSEEALRLYNAALVSRPEYSRALVGRAGVLYQIALRIAGDNPPPHDPALELDRKQRCSDIEEALPDSPQLLGELALRCYREARLSQDKPETADIEVKVAYGEGQVNTWMALYKYGEDRWSEAVPALEEVLLIYESASPEKQARIQATTAHAHGLLGLHLIITDGTNPDAVVEALNHYNVAVMLLETDINLAYNTRWIEVYNQQAGALRDWLADRITPTPGN